MRKIQLTVSIITCLLSVVPASYGNNITIIDQQPRYLTPPANYQLPTITPTQPSQPQYVPPAPIVQNANTYSTSAPPLVIISDSRQPQYMAPAPVAEPQIVNAYPTASQQPEMQAQPTRRSSLNQLPSYSYDPNLDPQKTAYHTPKARDPKASGSIIDLGTGTGGEIGLQASSYRYQEHVVANQEFMHLIGPNFGITLNGNKTYSNGFFFGGDFRIAYGKHDYTGGDVNLSTGATIPSTHNGETDLLIDTRLLGGHDFIFENAFGGNASFSISPYAGFGFRYLDNDGTGTDTNGVPGYERDSHYIYFPVGVTPRFRLTDLSRLSLNMEYDQLIYGWQVSSLGDTTPGAGDITNSQHDGYGLRGSLMYEWVHWSMGPFFNYWNINQSSPACDNYFCGVEPHNQTIEYGFQGRYRF